MRSDREGCTTAPRGRFAPSPTGDLHLGNARTALLAWCSLRAVGGTFVLRVEDLDAPRTVAAAVTGNLAELTWLGLDWDEGPDVGGPHAPYRQSERGEHYRAALDRLARAGLLHEDWLSRRDVRESASAPHGPTPRYGPAQRAQSERLAAERRAAGRSCSWRVRFPPATLELHDRSGAALRVSVEEEVGDLLVRRSDGLWAYHLAVVVDDAAMGISEVVRGADLWEATPAQVALQRALALPSPETWHVPLLLDAEGARIAKRSGGATLRALREGGADPARVRGALAASLGWLAAPRAISMRDLLDLYQSHPTPTEATRWQPGWGLV